MQAKSALRVPGLMRLRSTIFENNQFIPRLYTGEGSDLSPPLEWSNAPEPVIEYALICDDPDAPGSPDPFVHWLIYNIPAAFRALPEGLPPDKRIRAPLVADQGVNSFEKIGYNGPFPPVGNGVNHYVFRIYALNSPIRLKPGASKDELLSAMEGRILDAAQLIGRYLRETGRRTA